MKPDSTCPAMKDAGITNPNSQAGKDFCTQSCPYESGCVLYESLAPRTKAVASRCMTAIRLHENGMSVSDIAKRMRRTKETIWIYLRTNR